MNVGIIPVLNPEFGGSFQYSLAMLTGLSSIAGSEGSDHRFTLLLREGEDSCLDSLDLRALKVVMQTSSGSERFMNWVKRNAGHGRTRDLLRTLRRACARTVGRVRRKSGESSGMPMRRIGVDWALYTAADIACVQSDVPFVIPIHDLQHRLQPEFPEVSAGGEWQERERLYAEATRRATLVLADSIVGKEDILEFYGADLSEDRVKVLPFVPAPYLRWPLEVGERARIRAAYSLPERYFFYPAQFWPHKNHLRLVQALASLKDAEGVEAHLVLAGSHGGGLRSRTFAQVMQAAGSAGIEKQVHYLGYVPNQDMSGLYAESRALVMPTFFGPTNIPVVEAWMFDCPVLTSDVRGIREHVADAGVLVDPRSVPSIAQAMRRLWEDDSLCHDLTRSGRKRLSTYGPTDFRERLAQIVREASERVRSA